MCGWIGDAVSWEQNLGWEERCFGSIPMELDSVLFMRNDVGRNIFFFSPNQVK